MKRIKLLTAILATTAWLLGVASYAPAAQEFIAQPREDLAAQPSPQTASPLSAAELDQLTAPIALYSDPLLGMVLAASTYPPEIAEAASWLDTDDHASLHGAALDAALAQQGWDRSVKALVAVPRVLRMMSGNLEWTAKLGDAFLSQQADVMESIQRLRRSAATSGALQSGPQETVSADEGEVVIEPASADVIYVPCYTPAVYGPWPWPAYPPLYFPPPAGFCSAGPLISFSIGFGIVPSYWGWSRWNWRRRGFYVVESRHTRREPPTLRPWVHNPAHRRGARYPNRATAQRYLAPGTPTRRGDRRLPASPTRPPGPVPGPRTAPGSRSLPGAGVPIQRQPVPQPPRAMRHAPPASQSYRSRPPQRPQPARTDHSRSSAPRSQGERGGSSHGAGSRNGASRADRAHSGGDRGGRPPR